MAAIPEPSPAGPEVPPPPPPPPPTPQPSWRSTPVLLLVVVLVVAALLAVFLLGPFAGSSSSSSNPNGFSGARGVADQFASSYGSWDLFEVIGSAPYNGSILPYTGTSPPNCTLSVLVGSVPDNISIPQYRGNLTDGVASAWVFGYSSTTGSSDLLIVEVGETIVFALEESGSCIGQGIQYHGIPSSAIDSSTAATAAAAAGGYQFLRAHPTGVSVEMVLTGGLSFLNQTIPMEWTIGWTTCGGFFGQTTAPASGYQFTAAVNATTGMVPQGGTQNSTCGIGSLPPGIGGALTPGPPSLIQGAGTGGTVASQGCTSGDYCYSVPIESATNLTPADFSLKVSNLSNASNPPTPVGYAILGSSGQVLVYSYGSAEVTWTDGVGSSSTPLTAGMTVIADMGTHNPSGWSYSLEFTGLGPYVNSGLGVGL